jgi:hypothetical protein
MSSFFEKLRDGAGKKLLDRYGDVFRITRSSAPSFNPATGEVTASTVTQDVVGKAFTIEQKFDQGEMARTGRIEIYLTASGVSFEPQEGMSIKSPTDSTTPYQISVVKRIPESGVAVIYHVIALR